MFGLNLRDKISTLSWNEFTDIVSAFTFNLELYNGYRRMQHDTYNIDDGRTSELMIDLLCFFDACFSLFPYEHLIRPAVL
jgi:hypothetical protein